LFSEAGAFVATAGIIMFSAFVVILLMFPVIKECAADNSCTYTSTAPEPYNFVITQWFLAVSLLTIAAGVLLIRLGRWLDARAETKKA
jgi:hypothetical protein